MSSNPASVTIKAPLARKATGNHLRKPTSLGKTTALSLVSATLEIEYGTQIFNDSTWQKQFVFTSDNEDDEWPYLGVNLTQRKCIS